MKRNFHSNLAFTDLLFNTLLCFVVFFTIAIIQMKKADSVTEVEFDGYVLIVASWPPDYSDDVDLYVEDPAGEVIFFNNKSNKTMHLDRDDQGMIGDASLDNREIATIRSPTPGEYIVNVHLYTKREEFPTPVNVKVYSLKNNKLLAEEHLLLDYHGEEATVCRFTLNSDGHVLDQNSLPKSIVGRMMGRGY